MALAAPPEAPATPTGVIAEVVVYPDRASVTRTFAVDLKVGVNEVRFENLPPTLQDSSLQAAGSGVPGAKILGLDVVSRELAEDRRKRVSELGDRIEKVGDDIREAVDDADAAGTELGFLRKLEAAAAQQLSAELLFADGTPRDASGIADLLEQRVPPAQDAVRKAQIKQRELQATLDALQRELGTVQGLAQWSLRDVVVQIDSPAAGAGIVSLTYTLPGASWTPAYDARAHVADKTVDLTLQALIVQTTGEDWKDVSLTLSTARPAGGVAPPELQPFWLERPVPVYTYDSYDSFDDAKGRSGGAPAAPAAREYSLAEEEEADEVPAPPPPPMAVLTATVENQAAATTFKVPGASTVPGEGTRRKLRVTDAKLTVEFGHVAVPRVDAAAFLVAKGKWAADWPMLAGEVAAFLDDSFVGTQRIGDHGLGSDVEIAFGRDDAVRVKSEILTDHTSSTDWLGKQEHALLWRYTVTNGRKEAVNIEIRDRVPNSRYARYRVRYEGELPTEATPEGLYNFDRAVGPAASATVQFGYTVRYPAKNPPGGVR